MPPAPPTVENQLSTQDESLYDVVSTLGGGANSRNVKFKISYMSPDKPLQKKIFEAPSDVSLPYLKEKLQSTFNLETFENCKLSWTDEDGDSISIESNEELIIALHSMKNSVVRFSLESYTLDKVGGQSATSNDVLKKDQNNFLSEQDEEILL